MIYAANCKDNCIKKKSSSGGIYPILAEYVIQNNGVVYASVYDGDEIKYIAVESVNEIPQTQGAKYAPSNLQDTFIDLKKNLLNGRTVLFVGLPCHCAGLKTFLGKIYDDLIILGIVCHGVPSPIALSNYLQKRDVHFVNMRDKENGWSNYSWKMSGPDGETAVHHNQVSFMAGFIGDLYLRPCCYECHFKNRKDSLAADLVVGDFWGIQNIRPELFDDHGVSIVITNTERGQSILDAVIDKLSISIVEGEKYKKYNQGFSVATKTIKREKFFEGLEQGQDFDELVCQLLKPSLVSIVLQKIKGIIKKVIGR